MNLSIFLFAIAINFAIAVFYRFTFARNKEISFIRILLYCLFLSPFITWFLIDGSLSKKAKGCSWCGNKYNQAEFCGICSRNAEGLQRQSF